MKRPSDQQSIGNVLMVANFTSGTAYAWWLMEQFWLTIAKVAQSQGHSAFLAYPKLEGLSPSVANSGIDVVELSVPGDELLQIVATCRFIKQKQIKTIYFTDRSWHALWYTALRAAGVQRIIVHDHTPGDRLPVTGIRRLLKSFRNRLPWVTADRLFCVSPLMRTRDIENGCIPPERCFVVQNGINPVQLGNRRVIRDELNIDSDAVVVITTGRAHPYKRFDLVIETAVAVHTLAPTSNIIFLLVGDGPDLARLTQLIEQHGLESRVKLLGYRRDTAELLSAADIAMHAALGEGFSLSILEYMSAGLAVLVPDIPSVSQAIDPTSGVIYPRNDPEYAAKTILRLAQDADERRVLGRAAQQKVHTQFHLERSRKELVAHLSSV